MAGLFVRAICLSINHSNLTFKALALQSFLALVQDWGGDDVSLLSLEGVCGRQREETKAVRGEATPAGAICQMQHAINIHREEKNNDNNLCLRKR